MAKPKMAKPKMGHSQVSGPKSGGTEGSYIVDRMALIRRQLSKRLIARFVQGRVIA